MLTKDGSSSEPQPTEPMETTSGSLLGKRKEAETTEAEDPKEIEGDGDEEDSDSGWDKDSFDGLEYHSSDNNVYSDEELNEKCRYYNRTVIETKGFFEPSNKYPPYRWGIIVSVTSDDLEKEVKKGVTGREFMGNMASECVEKYNKRNNKNVKFDHFLRANFIPGGRTKYYITFAARESDSPDAPLVEYQAKVARCAGKTYPILCRPSPPPK
ncbi:hypothetical protein EUTSA_v10021511mg [Eutrema salsugineum]|uniref:Cystatin domain-containing protein n=1 Tax=Eutrema salsugineum TaxID=72664 RepID=V4LGB3_EUTSA|nr:uncharacterized protein LOC18024040 [Eutrema salsugineum]XP_006408077.1 uncharacterized protein LOC18024040 [Eutrema salsugineum]ESQ49529.1 hypothetical protein EUTSA_v10021511mg [Eutrema salsugineum]ESQ49530.1 hypothetical protein EUTSA_v10021511mg [Eutrema salsugineum]